jgi:UDP-N-acetylmuramate--alanine ligase
VKIFCSGIGGIGLSAYASLQRAAGHEVHGSDRGESALIADLRSQGIIISLQQDGSAVPADSDLFVYSEAIPPDHPERVCATKNGIRQISYFRALGEMSANHRVIAICGTHGKSSTTAMAAQVLVDAGIDPTIVVGTKVPFLGGRNWRVGKSNVFLLEACEYRRSFHTLHPAIAVLTTVDGDHFDAYSSIEEYREAFVDFFRLLPPDGPVIFHGSDADCAKVVTASGKQGIDADKGPLPILSVPGLHMRQNAQLVAALANVLGIPQDKAQESLLAFKGTWRRMEDRGTRSDGVTVIDDYGHHPREVMATLRALRETYPRRRIVCAFQPHTHDRTLKLYNDFLPAFRDVDVLCIAGIYAARSEADSATVDLKKFGADIARESGITVRVTADLTEAEHVLQSELLMPGDLLICMGAGDVTRLATVMLG